MSRREDDDYVIPYELVSSNQISDDGHFVRVGHFIDAADGRRRCSNAIHSGALSLWGYSNLEAALTDWGFESVPAESGWQYKGSGRSPLPGYVSGVLN